MNFRDRWSLEEWSHDRRVHPVGLHLDPRERMKPREERRLMKLDSDQSIRLEVYHPDRSAWSVRPHTPLYEWAGSEGIMKDDAEYWLPNDPWERKTAGDRIPGVYVAYINPDATECWFERPSDLNSWRG